MFEAWERKRVERKAREVLLGMVEYGILEVVKPADDPLEATYRIIDPEGVGHGLDELDAAQVTR